MRALRVFDHVSRKQERAIVALLTHNTLGEASIAVGIGEATIFRWLNDPKFAARYKAARREVWSQSLAVLQKAATDAALTLKKIATDEDAPASARVSAARAILEHSRAGIEVEELEERISNLEESVRERAPKP
jgi:hypothetical protein